MHIHPYFFYIQSKIALMFSVFGAELPLQKPWSGENYPCVFYIRRRTSLTISVPTKDNVAQGAGPVDHAHVSVPQDIPAPCYILDHTHEPTEILSYAFLAKEMDIISNPRTSHQSFSCQSPTLYISKCHCHASVACS